MKLASIFRKFARRRSMADAPVVRASRMETLEPRTLRAATADFNGDGVADIVFRNQANGLNYIWLMSEHQTVLETVALPTVSNQAWQIVAAGDVSGDDKPDLFWRNSVTGQNVVWTMSGTSRSVVTFLPTAPNVAWEIGAVADFTGDGKGDVLWRNIDSGQNAVWPMSNLTAGPAIFLASAPNPAWRITGSGDFNHDTHPDILWRNTSTGENAIWFLNNTDATGSIPIDPAPNQAWSAIGCDDFNNDNEVDILWRNATTGANAVWLRDANGIFSAANLPSETDVA